MRQPLTIWLLLASLGVLLYVLIVPKISSGGGTRSRITAANTDINGGIKAALENYKADNGHYPNGTNGLLALCQKSDGATNWQGPYLDKLPVDPWAGPYIYEYPGKHGPDTYDLFSAGPDGRLGTEDDIGNWTK